MPEITGFHYVGLTVRDIRLSVAWYAGLLGLTVDLERISDDGQSGEAVLRHPSTGLLLGLLAHSTNAGDAFSEFRMGLDHLEFGVASRMELEAWASHLDDLSIEHSPITERPGASILTFRDPDNIQLELYVPKPKRSEPVSTDADQTGVTIRPLQEGDVQPIADAFSAIGWSKPAAQHNRYLAEQARGERDVLVAFEGDTFAGYLTVVWRSGYPPFRDAAIPEIVDFNVPPQLRRRGIGLRLMDEAEKRIEERSMVAGIGVGMDAGYGAAQRLYVKRGYIPDGRSLTSHGCPVRWGTTVVANDGLALYFAKTLAP